jgi:hypothetical protein
MTTVARIRAGRAGHYLVEVFHFTANLYYATDLKLILQPATEFAKILQPATDLHLGLANVYTSCVSVG